MSEPPPLLRYGEVIAELAKRGIPPMETRKLIEANVIAGRPLRPHGRNFYAWAQIVKVIQIDDPQTSNQQESRKQ